VKCCRKVSETKIPKFQILRLYQIKGQEKKEAKKKLEGAQLHNYLRSKLVESQDTVSMPDISSVEQNSTLDDILPELKAGLECLNKHQMATLATSLAYGGWLNVAFDKFEKEKKHKGKTTEKWSAWLKNNVVISDAEGRRLRIMYKICGEYKVFYNLGISFRDLYARRKEISTMLDEDDGIANFWL
jgi:hypothetical protein